MTDALKLVLTNPDGTTDIIDPDRIREFGGMLFPNPPDQTHAELEMGVMLPAMVDNVLRDLPAGTRVLNSEVVVGNPAHTPGEHAPVGWYLIVEVPE